MERQLALIDERSGDGGDLDHRDDDHRDDYHLDDRTREVGRRAIAAARDILRAAEPRVERPAWDRRRAA